LEKVLIVDDEMGICTSIEFALENEYQVFTANNPMQIFEILHDQDIQVVLLDLKLGEYNGIDILNRIEEKYSNIQVIIMTAYSSIENAIQAIKNGAYYYLTKPIKIAELKLMINRAMEYQRLNSEINYLSNQIKQKYSLGNIIGKSKVMENMFELIEKVKDININILITGESGTGKELVAKAIHFLGLRNNNHFEAINCAAIPSNLLESELFGYVKGAYTGAINNKAGKFELANNGTIFLDEIGDMDLHLQAKLLRVIQDKEITRLGSNEKKQIDARIIAATNKDLEEEIAKKRFREDLYYRLNVINIKVPSLRERREDIPLLTKAFVKKYSEEFNKPIKIISPRVLELLETYDYKGNVRELENIIERLVVLSTDEKISYMDFPSKEMHAHLRTSDEEKMITIRLGDKLDHIEKIVIIETLKVYGGHKRKTAKALGISERSLYNKITSYGF